MTFAAFKTRGTKKCLEPAFTEKKFLAVRVLTAKNGNVIVVTSIIPVQLELRLIRLLMI
jgi:hypothetical protein